MRRAVLGRFILVLLAALCINSVIFYVSASHLLMRTTAQSLIYTLSSIDNLLDYDQSDQELLRQTENLEDFTQRDESRLTLIRGDGTVAADSDAEAGEMDNHLQREEVRQALETGEGYTTRFSETLGQDMLYAACRSRHSDMILRLAVPYYGMQEFLPVLFPAVIVSFLAALGISVIFSRRFAYSVTKPLQDISKEMLKVRGDYGELHFDRYKYPEINVIADTTMKMSRNVKDYLSRIEKEKQIRQEFFSNASHELKTPITSIQGYAELLESGMIVDEEMKADFARRIKKEAENMTGLINDILMISRLEAKDAEVVFSQVRISVLLDDILDSLKPLAAQSQVFIHSDCQPISIEANPQQMKELLNNLITNAVKYNRPGGQVWIQIREKGDDMLIRVRDNGMGIPEDSLDRIFERFYRVDKGRSRKQGGTGLGLSIVKHIVSFYQGTIRVSSELDKGSEFVVELPLVREKR